MPQVPDGAVVSFERLHETFAQQYRQYDGHVFIGACGIAVRILAPLLRHKSVDPSVVVLDVQGKHAISLVSGHLGGGNALAQRVATVLGASALVTTASDSSGAVALDMLLQELGLRIVDWSILPGIQAAILEQRPLEIWDPCHALWPHIPDTLRNLCSLLTDGDAPPSPKANGCQQICVHWRALPPSPGRLRVAMPCLTVGIGCRKNIPLCTLQEAFEGLLHQHGLARESVAALATVTEKGQEKAIQELAHCLGIPVLTYASSLLATVATPNPSPAAGKRFGTVPFSVCEAAALVGAGHGAAAGAADFLVVPKIILAHACTLAAAISHLPQEKS